MFFPYTGNVIIPTDGLNDLIFFRGLETTNQIMWGKKPVEGTANDYHVRPTPPAKFCAST